MSDRGSWALRAMVAGAIVISLGLMGCSQQKETPPVEEPPQAEVRPTPPPPLPAAAPARRATAPRPVAPSGEEQVYVVQKGDTLFSIAKRFGVKLPDLQEANNIQDPNLIKIGQKLVIPAGGVAPKGGGFNEPF